MVVLVVSVLVVAGSNACAGVMLHLVKLLCCYLLEPRITICAAFRVRRISTRELLSSTLPPVRATHAFEWWTCLLLLASYCVANWSFSDAYRAPPIANM